MKKILALITSIAVSSVILTGCGSRTLEDISEYSSTLGTTSTHWNYFDLSINSAELCDDEICVSGKVTNSENTSQKVAFMAEFYDKNGEKLGGGYTAYVISDVSQGNSKDFSCKFSGDEANKVRYFRFWLNDVGNVGITGNWITVS